MRFVPSERSDPVRLIYGDCLEQLRKIPDESVDALVTDPPAGISFMNREFDSDRGGRDKWIKWLRSIAAECLRVSKPGAHGLVWALPRTSHWTAMALELAGFEIRDCVQHLFGSGFPKSLAVGKAIDDTAGAEREVVGVRESAGYPDGGTAHYRNRSPSEGSQVHTEGMPPITAPATDEAAEWEGWGTALKPAAEFWWLVRKPLNGTVAENVLDHGTGGINVEGCRVEGVPPSVPQPDFSTASNVSTGLGATRRVNEHSQASGRWPTHLLLTHAAECNDRRCVRGCPVNELDAQSGVLQSGYAEIGSGAGPKAQQTVYMPGRGGTVTSCFADKGGASRFFPRFHYFPKPSRAEREAGCAHLPPRKGHEAVDREEGTAGLSNPRAGAGRTAGDVHNHHPTLKGLALMRWLVRLITPPDGVVLDPFMGSGTTGMAAVAEKCRFIGIEQDEEYVEIARARIEYAAAAQFEVENGGPRPERRGQQDLWSG